MKRRNVTIADLRKENVALRAALSTCAECWGWWNAEDPPLVSKLPKHAAVRAVIAEARKRERAKYAPRAVDAEERK